MPENEDDVYEFAGGPAPPLPPRHQHTVRVTRPMVAPQYMPPGRYRPPAAPPPKSAALRRWLIIGGSVVAAVVIFAVMITAIGLSARGRHAKVQPLRVDRAAFPARPQMRRLERGVRFCEVALRGNGPAQSMKVWVYLPEGRHRSGSLPCVFIAPAGSTLFSGMSLGDGDRPEHLPWVREGFAVVSYELDGEIPGELEEASNSAIASAARQFMSAEGGVSNAKTAIEYVLAKVPEVDPKRLYCAGHSSAATLALQLASKEPRIKACVAFAPATDIMARLAPLVVRELDRLAPGAERFLNDYSPVNMPTPQCPVFLFHAEDDSNVSVDQSKAYASTRGDRVKLVLVPSGDHYESMISQGIPAAIQWLKPMAGLKAKAAAPAPESEGAEGAAPPAEPEPPAENGQ